MRPAVLIVAADWPASFNATDDHDEIAARNRVMERSAQRLDNAVRTPRVIKGGVSTLAQDTIESCGREALAADLKSKGVPTAVYSPILMRMMVPCSGFPMGPGGLPETAALLGKVISLPMHPDLMPDVQDTIIGQVIAWDRGAKAWKTRSVKWRPADENLDFLSITLNYWLRRRSLKGCRTGSFRAFVKSLTPNQKVSGLRAIYTQPPMVARVSATRTAIMVKKGEVSLEY